MTKQKTQSQQKETVYKNEICQLKRTALFNDRGKADPEDNIFWEKQIKGK